MLFSVVSNHRHHLGSRNWSTLYDIRRHMFSDHFPETIKMYYDTNRMFKSKFMLKCTSTILLPRHMSILNDITQWPKWRTKSSWLIPIPIKFRKDIHCISLLCSLTTNRDSAKDVFWNLKHTRVQKNPQQIFSAILLSHWFITAIYTAVSAHHSVDMFEDQVYFSGALGCNMFQHL